MRRLLALCFQSVRANLVPGLALWVLALVVVGAYYFFPSAKPLYDEVGNLKSRYGYLYSALTTAFFGGMVPFVWLVSTGKIPRAQWVSHGLFFVLLWLWKGVEVDFLYRMQAVWFGEAADVATITKKVIADQFIYCPFWSAPTMALLYRWKDSRFAWQSFRRSLDREFFLLHMPAVQVAMWMVWIPGTAFIYAMPAALQIPLFSLVLSFFVLMVSLLGDGE